MKKFIIISYPRTGSTFLCKVLNSCYNIICHSEIFHQNFKDFTRAFLDDSPLIFIKKRNLFVNSNKAALRKLYTLRQKKLNRFLKIVNNNFSNIQAIGFKIFPDQNYKALKKIIDSEEYYIIYLYRENIIESFISEKIAMATGKWDSKYEKRELKKVELKKIDIEKYSEKIKSYEKILPSSFLPLSYEEITTDFPVNKIEGYLNINLKNLNLNVDEKKQNTFPLINTISNYSSIKKELKNSEYINFFDASV